MAKKNAVASSVTLGGLIGPLTKPVSSDDFNLLVQETEAYLGRSVTNYELGAALGRGDTHISRYRSGTREVPYAVGVLMRLIHSQAKSWRQKAAAK